MTGNTSESAASDEPPSRAELARTVDHQQSEIQYLRETVGSLSDRMARVEEGIKGLRDQVRQHMDQAHQDSQAIAKAIGELKGNNGNGSTKERVAQATGAVRFGRWLMATLLALLSALAMWWDKVVAVLKAALATKGGP